VALTYNKILSEMIHHLKTNSDFEGFDYRPVTPLGAIIECLANTTHKMLLAQEEYHKMHTHMTTYGSSGPPVQYNYGHNHNMPPETDSDDLITFMPEDREFKLKVRPDPLKDEYKETNDQITLTDLDDLITLSGVAENTTDLFTGSIIADSSEKVVANQDIDFITCNITIHKCDCGADAIKSLKHSDWCSSLSLEEQRQFSSSIQTKVIG